MVIVTLGNSACTRSSLDPFTQMVRASVVWDEDDSIFADVGASVSTQGLQCAHTYHTDMGYGTYLQ